MLQEGLRPNIRNNQLVFPLHLEVFRSSSQRIFTRTCITKLTFHYLRYQANRRFYEKGLCAMGVIAITGHKDPRILKRYSNLRTEDLTITANSVPDYSSKMVETPQQNNILVKFASPKKQWKYNLLAIHQVAPKLKQPSQAPQI